MASPTRGVSVAEPFDIEPSGTDMAVSLSSFERGDLDAAVALSQAEGWPHTRDDWALLASVGEGVVARDGATLIGTAFWVPYGLGMASIGMVMVTPSRRGAGIGRMLMQRALDNTSGRTLRLVSTKAGYSLYRTLGFVDGGKIFKLQGQASMAALGPRNGVLAAQPGDHASIYALDKAAFGADRSPLIAALLDVGDTVVLRDPFITGFAIRRHFGTGLVIGPVVAPSLAAAKRLIATQLVRTGGTTARIDTSHPALRDWLKACGLVEDAGDVAMVREDPDAAEPYRVSARGAVTYALAAQAYG